MQNMPIEEDEIDLSKLFKTLKKRWFTILFITFLITLGVANYSYFLQPIYNSSVKISFADEDKSSMSAIMPEAFSSFAGVTEKKLETVKLTLETRKFINSAIENLNLTQHSFIEHNYKKNEVYAFEDLDVFLNIHDDKLENRVAEDNNKSIYQQLLKIIKPDIKTLYGAFFKITPIDNKRFLLTVEALNYSEICNFNTLVSSDYFSIKVVKKSDALAENYYVTQDDPTFLADYVLKKMSTNILSDNVMEITYNDTVPQRAKEVISEIADKFRALTLTKKTSELKKRLAFLDGQIGIIEKQLKGEGKNLKDYQKKSQTFFTAKANNKIILEKLSSKKEMVQKLKLQLQELNRFKESLSNGELNTVALLTSGINISSMKSIIELYHATDIELEEMRLQSQNIEKALTKRPQLEALIQQLQAEKIRLKALNFNFTPTHPQVLQANNTIAEIESDIRNYIQTDMERLSSSKASLQEKILTNIVTTQKNIRNKLSLFESDIKREKKLMQSIPEKSLTVQELKGKFALSENIYTFLLQKKMETQMALASIIENTQIIENAREAIDPIKPNKKLIVIVGFITGLILAIFYALLKAMLDTKIRNEEDIKELTDVPLYGSLPNKKNQRFFEEAIRNIRTNLQFVLPKDKKCINILLSSTIASEGKTTVTTNLAEVLAQTKKRVLVMDLDLRKPRLYQELKLSNKLGMTQYLTSDLELNECIQKVNDHLDFFPAGAIPPNPSELLMSEKFKASIETLSLNYDYILFDTAPIGSVIDAKILLPYSDITLLVVRANIAEKGFIDHFNTLRHEAKIESSGIILNDVKLHNSKNYGYGYGYGYGI